MFNIQMPPFDNVLVRQAFIYSVDRQAIVKLFDGVSPATNFTPPDVLGRDLIGQVGLSLDPIHARQLLTQAGYPGGKGFPQVNLGFNVDSQGGTSLVAETMVEMWKKNLNIEVNLSPQTSWDSYLQMLADNPPALFRMGWSADFRDPDNFLNGTFHTRGRLNFIGYSNPDYDRLIEQAATIYKADPLTRLEAYIYAEKILLESDAVILPLYHYHMTTR